MAVNKCSHLLLFFFFYIINTQFVLTLKQIIIQKSYACFTCDFCIYMHAYECTTYAYYNANRSKSTAIITRYYNVYLRVPTRIQIISKTQYTHDIIYLYIYRYITAYMRCYVLVVDIANWI